MRIEDLLRSTQPLPVAAVPVAARAAVVRPVALQSPAAAAAAVGPSPAVASAAVAAPRWVALGDVVLATGVDAGRWLDGAGAWAALPRGDTLEVARLEASATAATARPLAHDASGAVAWGRRATGGGDCDVLATADGSGVRVHLRASWGAGGAPGHLAAQALEWRRPAKRVVALALNAAASRLAALGPDEVIVFDVAGGEAFRIAAPPHSVFRGCAFDDQGRLCLISSRHAFIVRDGAHLDRVEDVVEPRCVAAARGGGGFVLVCDAPLRLSATPPAHAVAAPLVSETLDRSGEALANGFGGGRIPAALMLLGANDAAPDGPRLGPPSGPASFKGPPAGGSPAPDGPWLVVVRGGAARARAAPVRRGPTLDVLAVSREMCAVASSFDASCAVSTHALPGLEPLRTFCGFAAALPPRFVECHLRIRGLCFVGPSTGAERCAAVLVGKPPAAASFVGGPLARGAAAQAAAVVATDVFALFDPPSTTPGVDAPSTTTPDTAAAGEVCGGDAARAILAALATMQSRCDARFDHLEKHCDERFDRLGTRFDRLERKLQKAASLAAPAMRPLSVPRLFVPRLSVPGLSAQPRLHTPPQPRWVASPMALPATDGAARHARAVPPVRALPTPRAFAAPSPHRCPPPAPAIDDCGGGLRDTELRIVRPAAAVAAPRTGDTEWNALRSRIAGDTGGRLE